MASRPLWLAMVVAALALEQETSPGTEIPDEILSPVCFEKDWSIPNPRLEPPMTSTAIEQLMDRYNEGLESYKDCLDAFSMSLYNIGVVCSRRRSQCFESQNFRSNYQHRKVSPSKCELETFSWHQGLHAVVFYSTDMQLFLLY